LDLPTRRAQPSQHALKLPAISLHITPHPQHRDLFVFDFVNVNDHKEQVGKPGLGIQAGRKIDFGTPWWSGNEVGPELCCPDLPALRNIFEGGTRS
ncbi:hypothetical protein FS749_007360, partial [Ceratobasidium sp. UAMH 11750]